MKVNGWDRVVTVAGLSITAIPEFVTGIFLILVFGIWLKLLPAVTLFLSDDAVFQNPQNADFAGAHPSPPLNWGMWPG